MSIYKTRRSDLFLDVPMGLHPYISSVNKFGENHDVAADSTETIWEGSNLYPFPASALITHASMKADQVAMRGGVIEVQGLDNNFNAVTQNVTLNASNTTTAVALTTALRRVFRVKVLANVVTDQIITIHNAGNTVDYAHITAGENQTTMAIYTVAANHTAFLTNYYATHHPAANQNPTSLDIKLWAQDNHNSYAPQLKHTVGIPTGGQFQHALQPYYKFTQKSDIYVTATTVGKAAHVSAGYDLFLVHNDLIP